MFSHSGKPTGIFITTAHYLNHLVEWKMQKFGQFILSKVIKVVATTCHISRLKCTKFDFGWGSAPDPAGVAYSAPQTRSWI